MSQLKIKQVDGLQAALDAAGGGATGPLQSFTAFKTGNQLSTGTFVDLTGWATPVIDDAAFSFNTTTGVLTFDEDGRYLIIINVEGTANAGNRTQMEVQMLEDTGGGFTAQAKAIWRNYSSRNAVQNDGGLTGTYVADYNTGDDIKFQILDVGNVFTVATDNARIFAVKLEGAKGDAGAAGSNGTNGTDGEKWFTGSGAPSGGTGQDGDLYLDTANGDVYEKSGGSWGSAIANLTGPAGAGAVDEAFNTIAVSGQSNVVADSATDTLTLAVGGGVVITTNATTDTLTFSVERAVQLVVVDFATALTTGDGKFYFHIDSRLAGMNLADVHAEVITAGTTGTTDIQIHNLTQAADMLSTVITIDSGETGSDSAATAAVIDTANDDVALNDLLRVDIDAISTTAPQGLIITLGFRLP